MAVNAAFSIKQIGLGGYFTLILKNTTKEFRGFFLNFFEYYFVSSLGSDETPRIAGQRDNGQELTRQEASLS